MRKKRAKSFYKKQKSVLLDCAELFKKLNISQEEYQKKEWKEFSSVGVEGSLQEYCKANTPSNLRKGRQDQVCLSLILPIL